MTDKLISEGTFAMLKEILYKMNNNPQQNLINERLEQIEKTCNDLDEKNKKQDEKIEELKRYILGYYKDIKEEIAIQQKNISVKLERIENILKEHQERQGILRRFDLWVGRILNLW